MVTGQIADHNRHAASHHEMQEPSLQIRDDPAISPRRETPQISFHDSPRVVKPSQSLDVSDVESEINVSGNAGNVRSPRNALFVTTQTTTATAVENSEVLLQADVTNSPVMVCHPPGKIYTDLRNTGDVDLATQVRVDQPHKVNIVSEEDATMSRNRNDDADMHKPVKKPPDVKPKISASLFSDDEDFEHSEEHEKNGWSQVESLPDNSVTQHSLDDQATDPNKENISTTSSVQLTITKPKRKKSHTVESRYMSHFGSVTTKGPMKAFDRNTLIKSSALLGPVSTNGRKQSQSHSSTTQAVRPRKVASKTEKGQRQTKKATSTILPAEKSSSSRTGVGSSRCGSTPDMKSYKGGVRGSTNTRAASADRKSSTPTAESAALPETADISAIGPPTHKLHHSTAFASPSFEVSSYDIRSPQSAKKKLGFVSTHHASHPKSAKKGNSLRVANSSTAVTSALGLSSFSSQNTSSKPQSRQAKSHVTQMELDLTYARMLQWVYPYASLKYGVKEREKHFMEQVEGIRGENENLRQRKHALELQLAQLKHMNALDEALTIQESGLSTVCSSLTEFRQQYRTLAQSLDTTRHQIPTVDILIPDNEEDFQAELEHCLAESEQLLTELQLMSRGQTVGVTQCAKSLELMSTDLQAELRERNRCAELLAAAGMLSNKEASLQTMQLLTEDSALAQTIGITSSQASPS